MARLSGAFQAEGSAQMRGEGAQCVQVIEDDADQPLVDS